MQRFSNKTILITGASSGIGLAGAKRLIAEGAHVIITGRTASRLNAAAAELGANATAILDDAADGNTLTRLLPVVERSGKLEGLWLNAAYAVGTPLEATDKTTIEQMLQVNVVAPMLQMGALSPYLRDGASVVVTSSSAVYEGQPQVALYAASKAAILAVGRQNSRRAVSASTVLCPARLPATCALSSLMHCAPSLKRTWRRSSCSSVSATPAKPPPWRSSCCLMTLAT